MSTEDWRPTASHSTLKRRAEIIRDVRSYFTEQAVLEVETPILSQFGGTDVHLSQWQTRQGQTLHTSPEFAMKRLLAAGSGDIVQIARVFRQDESSKRHNAEFTMLEWYRLGFDEHQLMQDVLQLLSRVSHLPTLPSEKLSYRDVFLRFLLPDPLHAPLGDLQAAVSSRLNAQAQTWTRDDCLNALMSMVVEPQLPKDTVVFVYNFPASQAALANFGVEAGTQVGRRFECFWQGMELANGYFELTDPEEQRRRFEKDNELRAGLDLEAAQIDERFLAALSQGMPDCAGVALGLDRLVMILTGARSIEDVIAFPFERA